VHTAYRVFLNKDGRIRPGWRFAIFLGLFFAGGKVLDLVLSKVNLPDRGFTWRGLLLDEAFCPS
jgi:hypothetical protein